MDIICSTLIEYIKKGIYIYIYYIICSLQTLKNMSKQRYTLYLVDVPSIRASGP